MFDKYKYKTGLKKKIPQMKKIILWILQIDLQVNEKLLWKSF